MQIAGEYTYFFGRLLNCWNEAEAKGREFTTGI
jgi:hypothetical protein